MNRDTKWGPTVVACLIPATTLAQDAFSGSGRKVLGSRSVDAPGGP
jgi:hypothetical protein